MKDNAYFPMETNISILNQDYQDLKPLVCGWEACSSRHRYGPAVRDYYLLHYVVSGRGIFRRGGKTYSVEANRAFLICPGEVTCYEADDIDPWTYIWIGFTGELSDTLIQQILVNPDQCIIADARIGRIFLEIRAESENRPSVELFLTGKLFELFSILCQPSAWQTRQEEYVLRATDYIKANYDRPISIEGISRMIGIERHYLCRIFSEKTGQTPQEYLNHVRMHRAAEYLSSSKYSVQEAARSVGYTDAFTFSKAFKRQFGLAPRLYRERNEK